MGLMVSGFGFKGSEWFTKLAGVNLSQSIAGSLLTVEYKVKRDIL